MSLFIVKDQRQYTQTRGNSNPSFIGNREPFEPTQDHLNHFNDHGNFTMPSSQASQQAYFARLEDRGAATTGHGIPNKFKQQNRYNRAVGLDVPPGRPEKHIVDKDPKSIYDQHPYENVENDMETSKQFEDIYEQVNPVVPQHQHFEEVDNWNDLPRSTTNGELIRQPAYKSSIDIRSRPPELYVHQGRFTMGSANGLDTQTHPLFHDDPLQRRDPSLTFQSPGGAASRRANYQHSNTDPLAQSPQACHPHMGFADPPNIISSTGGKHLDGVHTEPRPNNWKNICGLTYGNFYHDVKSSRTRSVDNIVKGIEHDPCPRITGNSVFYASHLTEG